MTTVAIAVMASGASAQDRGRDDHRDRGRDHNAWRDRDRERSSTTIDIRIGVNSYRDNHNFYRHEDRPPVFEEPRHWDDRRPRSSVDIVFRSGYYGYGIDWRDRNFGFRFYVFDYPHSNPAFSPWYYYPQMPACVDSRKVRFDPRPLRIDVGRRERFDSRDSRLDKDLTSAIWDLTDAVEKGDNRIVGNLIPRGYDVIIDPPLGRSYRLNSDDFYGLFSDMATITHTRTFDVTDVQAGRDWAVVFARQDFEDPWGQRTTEYMRVTLEYSRSGYRIAELATSRRGF